MKKQLKKALEIAAKTGDKIIVVDEMTDKGLVVMGLQEYEKLLAGQDEFEDDYYDFDEEDDWDDWKKKDYQDDDFNDDNFTIDDDFKIEDAEVEPDPFKIPFTEENKSFEDEKEEFPLPDEDSEPVSDEDEEVKPAGESVSAEDENMYYYQEPSSAEATDGKPQDKEPGFTSVKDELKDRKRWDIPTDVKKGAEEVVERS